MARARRPTRDRPAISIGGDDRTAEPKHQVAVEIELQRLALRVTRRVKQHAMPKQVIEGYTDDPDRERNSLKITWRRRGDKLTESNAGQPNDRTSSVAN